MLVSVMATDVGEEPEIDLLPQGLFRAVGLEGHRAV